jgi:hypothetical protein
MLCVAGRRLQSHCEPVVTRWGARRAGKPPRMDLRPQARGVHWSAPPAAPSLRARAWRRAWGVATLPAGSPALLPLLGVWPHDIWTLTGPTQVYATLSSASARL